jgi:hypothetical protein
MKSFVHIYHAVFINVQNVFRAYLISELSVNKKVPTRFVIIYHVNLRFFTIKIVNYAHIKKVPKWTFYNYGNKKYTQKQIDVMLMSSLQHMLVLYQQSQREKQRLTNEIYQLEQTRASK